MSAPARVTVAIDVGTTGTKVGFFVNGESHVVKKYPDGDDRKYLPTVVAYLPHNHIEIGFRAKARRDDPGVRYFQLFKMDFPDGTALPDSRNDKDSMPTKRLYEDFLRMLFPIIQAYFDDYVKSESCPKFGDSTVQFVFSVPAVQNSGSIGKALVQAAVNAGYESRPSRIVLPVALTESEATAIAALKVSTETTVARSILVVDVGGGTSDLCALRVSGVPGAVPVPIGIKPVDGQSLGGAHVDLGFEASLVTKLSAHSGALGETCRQIARKTISNDEFERLKFAVGRGMQQTIVNIKFPELAEMPSVTVDDNIERKNGIFTIKGAALVRFVEEQLVGAQNSSAQGIRGQIDTVVEDLYTQSMRVAAGPEGAGLDNIDSNAKLDLVMFSGGFGGCDYVHQRLASLLTEESGSLAYHENLVGVKFALVPKPQLAVINGLLEYHKDQAVEDDTPGKPKSLRARFAKFGKFLGGGAGKAGKAGRA